MDTRRTAHPAGPGLPGRVLLAIALLAVAAGPVRGATYYVSPGGSDTNAGTQAAPWRTLAKANATLVAGDVCQIAAGAYSDGIQPAANGSAAAPITYVGSLANPAVVSVGPISIYRAYIRVKGVRSTSDATLGYTSPTARALGDSIVSCVTGGGLSFMGARRCVVYGCTINGPVAFLLDNAQAYVPPGVANTDSCTLRRCTIDIGTIAVKGFILRGYTQYCTIDSNRVSGQFAAANGSDIQLRFLYLSQHNLFRDNSWRAEADGPLSGGAQYTAFSLRDSSCYNVFERDTMLCGLQSGWDIGGRLASSGNTQYNGTNVGNRWSGCVFRTTGWTASLEPLKSVILENTVFASKNYSGLWLLSDLQNTIIRNCTFVAWNGPALNVDGDIRPGGNSIHSNIFYADSVAACYSGRSVALHHYTTGFTSDYNLYYARAATAGVTPAAQSLYWSSGGCSAPGAGTAWASATGDDTHSRYGAPLLVDARWASLDARLQAGSAAIGMAQGGGDAGAFPFASGGGDVTPPAAVADLAAVQVSNDYVLLQWTAPGDDGTSGTAAAYDLRYSTQPITEANFAAATPVATAPAVLPAGSAQNYAATGLAPSTSYSFALKTRDAAGNWSSLGNVVAVTTSALDVVPPARINDLR